MTAAASAGSYFLAIEPYRARGSVIGWVGASLAVAFAVRTLLVVFFDRPAYVFPDPLPFRGSDDGFWHVGGATIQAALARSSPRGRRRARRARSGGCCSARASAARSRRSPRTSTPPCSSACRSRASSASRSRWPGVWAGLAAILAAPSGGVRRGHGRALRPLRAARGGRRLVRAAAGVRRRRRARPRAGDDHIGALERRGRLPRRDAARARAACCSPGARGRRRRRSSDDAQRVRRGGPRRTRRLAAAHDARRSSRSPSPRSRRSSSASRAPPISQDGLYLACAAVGLAFVVGVAGLPLLAQGAFVAIGAVTARTSLDRTRRRSRARWQVVSPRRSSERRSRGCRGPDSRSRRWIVSWLVAFACSRSTGCSAARRESSSPGARHRSEHYELGAPADAARGARLRGARTGADRAAARRGPRARAGGESARRSGRAAADHGARRVRHGRRPRRSAHRAPRGSRRSRLVQPVPVVQALRRRPDRRAAVRARGRRRRARARGAVGGRRRDRLARARRRRAFAHAARGDHAARRRLARLGGHRAARAGAGVVPTPARGPAAARRPASRPRGLTKRYGDVTAADNIDLDVEPGRITALVGPNGSGKTTVLRMLAAGSMPDAGRIDVGAARRPDAAGDRRLPVADAARACARRLGAAAAGAAGSPVRCSRHRRCVPRTPAFVVLGRGGARPLRLAARHAGRRAARLPTSGR